MTEAVLTLDAAIDVNSKEMAEDAARSLNRLCSREGNACFLTLLEPRSRFGDKLPRIRLLCPQNGTAVLKGLSVYHRLEYDLLFSLFYLLSCFLFRPCVIYLFLLSANGFLL